MVYFYHINVHTNALVRQSRNHKTTQVYFSQRFAFSFPVDNFQMRSSLYIFEAFVNILIKYYLKEAESTGKSARCIFNFFFK